MEAFECGSVAHQPEGAIPVRGRRLGQSRWLGHPWSELWKFICIQSSPPVFLCGDEVSTNTPPGLSLMLSLPD